MKVIYNNILPPGHFRAINLFGVIFAKRKYGRLASRDLNHEYIHTIQQREMLILFFYLWYVIEWVFKYMRYRNWTRAYYNISFEREAYHMQHDLDYRHHRRFWAWLRYI